MKRLAKADALKKAAVGYLVKKNFGVNVELGVTRNGKYRADVIGIDRRGHIIIMEIKSCKADFITDSKYQQYLKYCSQFYFVMCEHTFKQVGHTIDDKRIGFLILCPKTGYLKAKKSSQVRQVEGKIQWDLILRLAWRNATHSKRNTYRTKVFLE